MFASVIRRAVGETTKHKSGIVYTVLQEGTGKAVPVGCLVKTHYRGTFLDGKEFDSSYKRRSTFDFTAGGQEVIPGWDIMVTEMKKGEKRTFDIPPALAYGASGIPGVIPRNATLRFEMEVIDFTE